MRVSVQLYFYGNGKNICLGLQRLFSMILTLGRLKDFMRTNNLPLPNLWMELRVGILSPAVGREIDSRNRVSNWVAKLHRLAGRYDNPVPIWFLATLAGFTSKLPTRDYCSIAVVALLELTAVVEGFMTNKQDLDLSSNLISSLPASVFANSPLSSLSLANNSLTALQPKLFSGLSNLLHLGKLFHLFFIGF